MERLPDFEGLALFVKISEAGSISAVGRELDLPKSTISKRLCALEERLGVQLLNRTTRRMSLTDAGRGLLERAGRAVREIATIEHDLVARSGMVEGRVRLMAPVGFGQAVILPLVRSFLERHPAVSLEMSLADRQVDMVAERFDLLVHCGPIADTSLIARHLRDCRRLLVASPHYLKSAPPLTGLADIRNHHAIILEAEDDRWTFLRGGDEVTIHVNSRLAVQNLIGIQQAAREGIGLALIPDYVVADDLREGRLVQLLPDIAALTVPASLLYPASHVQPPAVRKAIEFLLAELRAARH